MTTNIVQLLLAAAGGGLLGLFYFIGLRWTVYKGLGSSAPGLWFSVSFLLRSGVCLGGFYWISEGEPLRILPALIGFLIARIIVTKSTGNAGRSGDANSAEARHAS